VILLRYFETAGKLKKAISVLKKRSGAHEESIRELRFDSQGIHLSEPLSQFQGILTGVPALMLPPAGSAGSSTEGHRADGDRK
jgi:circadian clock protein KaiC